MNRLDAFLLDRVFQPTANWVEPWCTPFQIARWAACGGAIGWFVASFHNLTTDHGFALAIPPFFTLAVFSTIADAERACMDPKLLAGEHS